MAAAGIEFHMVRRDFPMPLLCQACRKPIVELEHDMHHFFIFRKLKTISKPWMQFCNEGKDG